MQKRTLDSYIDRARERQSFKSDRALSVAMGFKTNAVTFWRNGRAWPSDEKMVELAQFAGIDPDMALLDLSSWRTVGEARKTYENILQKIGKMAIFAGAAATVLAFSAHSADALPRQIECAKNVSYGK